MYHKCSECAEKVVCDRADEYVECDKFKPNYHVIHKKGIRVTPISREMEYYMRCDCCYSTPLHERFYRITMHERKLTLCRSCAGYICHHLIINLVRENWGDVEEI